MKTIVSLTTIPSRCEHVVDAARSIFGGTKSPDALELNLVSSDFANGVPEDILNYRNEEPRFSIHFSETNYYSATKLIPTVKRHPEDIIIVIDEDKEYNPTVVEHLLSKHEKHKNCVISMKAEIVRDTLFGPRILQHGTGTGENEDFYMFPCTGAGALFPPHVFDGTPLFDDKLFLEWQKPQDDRWYWMNYALNGIKTINAVRYESDKQFSAKDFVTKDAIHNFLVVPENIKSLDNRFFKWMVAKMPLAYCNIPKLMYKEVRHMNNGVGYVVDEYGWSWILGKTT